MSEPLKSCPHCQGTDMKIQDRLPWDGGGKVLTCQNSKCIARIWGHDEADVTARWNRRTPGPATQIMVEFLEGELRTANLNFHSGAIPAKSGYSLVAQISVDVVRAFIKEWKGSGA